MTPASGHHYVYMWYVFMYGGRRVWYRDLGVGVEGEGVCCVSAYELQHSQRRLHTVCLNVIGGNMAMPESLDQSHETTLPQLPTRW